MPKLNFTRTRIANLGEPRVTFIGGGRCTTNRTMNDLPLNA